MNHPVKECIQKLGLTHRAFVVLYDISWERFRSCLYGYTDSIPRAILNVMLSMAMMNMKYSGSISYGGNGAFSKN